MSRDAALRAIRERWRPIVGNAPIVYANWKREDGLPDPGAADVWVQESLAGESSIDAALGRETRWRRYTGVVQLMLHGRIDAGTAPILALADAIEVALLTGTNIAIGITPVLVYDVTLGDPRENVPWYQIPMAVFYTYTVAL